MNPVAVPDGQHDNLEVYCDEVALPSARVDLSVRPRPESRNRPQTSNNAINNRNTLIDTEPVLPPLIKGEFKGGFRDITTHPPLNLLPSARTRLRRSA